MKTIVKKESKNKYVEIDIFYRLEFSKEIYNLSYSSKELNKYINKVNKIFCIASFKINDAPTMGSKFKNIFVSNTI